MCYSFESSLNNWFVILLVIVVLIVTDDERKLKTWIALFSLIIAQIQLIEAMIWSELGHKNKNQERLSQLVKYIVLLLWVQPLIQCFLAFYVTNNVLLLYLTFLYFLIFLYQIKVTQTDKFDVKKGKNGHLVWLRYRNNREINITGSKILGLIYLFGFTFPVIFFPNKVVRAGLILFILIILFYAYRLGNEFSSILCYYALFSPLLGFLLFC